MCIRDRNGILIVQGVDAESGIAALYVNGNEFTELTNNTLNVRLQKADTSYEYFTLQAKDKAGNMSCLLYTSERMWRDCSMKSSPGMRNFLNLLFC